MTRWQRAQMLGFAAALAAASAAAAQSQRKPNGDWPYYSGDAGSTKYSPLDQINASNVGRLRVVWRHPAVPVEIAREFPELLQEVPGREKNETNDQSRNNFETTPIVANGVMYTPNGVGLVEAIDPATGGTLWMQEPLAPGLQGFNASRRRRGVGYWADAADERIFTINGRYLIALDAKTGKPRAGFGENGRVDLAAGFNRPMTSYGWGGFPLVIRDVVVIGGSARGPVEQGVPLTVGDIRAYDVRTGAHRWSFRSKPQGEDYGADTWHGGSWKHWGGADVWSNLSGDPELGYVYAPVAGPESDWYGGNWPGNNLFSTSIVCIDAKTGKRVWHFQMVHHDIWDYEVPAAPILADITVNGRRIKAVVQLMKTGFAFVFDRVTGAPVWPIEERPVPKGNTPGEWYSPTQPFPTKPPPFERQGITTEDLINFTPALYEEALAIAKRFVIGPLFTPGSIKSTEPGGTLGTLMLPSWLGGANWDGAGFDPDTGILYVPSMTAAVVHALIPNPPGSRYAYRIEDQRDAPGPHGSIETVSPELPPKHGAAYKGLPLTKPPYGRLTAIDLNRGEHKWMVPIGDGPRNHPLLKDLKLPPLGTPGRRAPLVTKTLLFLGEGDRTAVRIPYGGGGNMFRAYDKRTGAVIWETEFPRGVTGAPMTYMAGGKQYVVVAIGGLEYPAELVALALP